MDDSYNTGSQPKQHFIEAIFAAISWANFFLAIFDTLFGSYEYYEQVAMLIVFMIIVDWVRSIFHYYYVGYFSWLTTLPAKCYTKCKEEAREAISVSVFLRFMATISYAYYLGALLLLAVFVHVSSTDYIWHYPWFRPVHNYRAEYLTPSGIESGVLIFSALLLAFRFRNRFSGTFYSEIDGKQYAIRSSTASNTDRYRRDSQRGRDSTSGNETKFDYSRRRTTNGESSLRNRGKATTTEEREPVSDNPNEGQ